MAAPKKGKKYASDVYNVYKFNASKRGYNFDLTYEEVLLIISRPCVYCGGQEDNHWNGIDRVDNNTGYEIGNVVTCCAMCNKFKSNLGLTTFLSHVKKIADYQKGV